MIFTFAKPLKNEIVYDIVYLNEILEAFVIEQELEQEILDTVNEQGMPGLIGLMLSNGISPNSLIEHMKVREDVTKSEMGQIGIDLNEEIIPDYEDIPEFYS